MTTQKLTSMREKEIREFLADEQVTHAEGLGMAVDCRICTLILAWIEQAATVDRLAWRPMSYQRYYVHWGLRKLNPHYGWTDADWIAAVKARVGFKETEQDI